MTYNHTASIGGRTLQHFVCFLCMLFAVVAIAAIIGATSGVDVAATEPVAVQTAGVPIPQTAVDNAHENGTANMPLVSTQDYELDEEPENDRFFVVL